MGAFFFSLLPNANAGLLRVAVLDTGFCPTLIKTPSKVKILPVSDLTQSVKYKCVEDQLKSRRFHGHWVLAEILNELKDTDIKENIEIHPMVIFNNSGEQKLRYWNRALEEVNSKSINLIIAAAGLPLLDNHMRQQASQIKLSSIPFILAAARNSPGIPKDSILFPHSLLDPKNQFTFGSYHKGIDEKGPHFKDTSLIDEKEIDYYFPFNFKPRLFGELKGTSLAAALGSRFILKNCLKKELNSVALDKCLQKAKKNIVTLKDRDSFLEVKELVFQEK